MMRELEAGISQVPWESIREEVYHHWGNYRSRGTRTLSGHYIALVPAQCIRTVIYHGPMAFPNLP